MIGIQVSLRFLGQQQDQNFNARTRSPPDRSHIRPHFNKQDQPGRYSSSKARTSRNSDEKNDDEEAIKPSTQGVFQKFTDQVSCINLLWRQCKAKEKEF